MSGAGRLGAMAVTGAEVVPDPFIIEDIPKELRDCESCLDMALACGVGLEPAC